MLGILNDCIMYLHNACWALGWHSTDELIYKFCQNTEAETYKAILNNVTKNALNTSFMVESLINKRCIRWQFLECLKERLKTQFDRYIGMVFLKKHKINKKQ